ncbi:MAG: hypothetical protein H7066_01345 [Cytophagaceae bacterium]|nr:hypothetical protein [Gemmatimonadaceae bacterium]
MGTLVARRYPTIRLLEAADHTYVECGTGGKAWKCWGGKTGGTAVRVAWATSARTPWRRLAVPKRR